MDPQELAELEALCRSLASGGPLALRWSWDARLGAVLTTFTADQVPAVQQFLESPLPARWDRGSLHRAPEPVQRLVIGIGGVRLDQKILGSDVTKPVVVMGAWWPWGGGQTISLRLFPVVVGPTSMDSETLMNTFRSWFGV